MKPKKNKRSSRTKLPRSIGKFFNIFLQCSQQSRSCFDRVPSESDPLIVSTSMMKRKNYKDHRHSCSQTSLEFHPCQSASSPRLYHSIDQKACSERTMPQIGLVKAEICSHPDEKKRQDDAVSYSLSSSSLSLSSPTSNCQSLLTIPDSYSTLRQRKIRIDYENNDNRIECSTMHSTGVEQTQTILPIPSTHFSYLIRPSTPCVLGQEDYDENIDDDEFFLTAGGIVHSCPNIYELSTDRHQKHQSCGDLLFCDPRTTSINSSFDDDDLNAYDTQFNRYSIMPRFQTMFSASSSSSLSTDSMNSDLKLKRERHAFGLQRQYQDDRWTNLSHVPTNWKSDNHLFFMPIIHHRHDRQLTPTLNSIDPNKRSRSHDIPPEPIYSSLMIQED